MTHTIEDRRKVLNRVRRLKGQIDALERALTAEAGCTEVMRLVSASRGAINGIMAEVLNGHIRTHMVDPARKPTKGEAAAAEELVGVLRSYIQ
jgi:DNA-binding FrmR family transcriptional regulator